MITPMSLRTKENLEAMFKQSRLSQEKKREMKKQQTLLLRKALYDKANIILKKAFQEERKKQIEQLQALIKKKPQKGWKCPQSKSYNQYQDKWMLWETDECDLLQTIEELKQWEKDNYPCINWNKWDELVDLTRQQIKDNDNGKTKTK